MVLGPQFHPDVISLINSRAASPNPILEGEDARKVFRAANIRQWPLLDAAQQYRGGYSREWSESIPASQTLHTTQKHLDARAVKSYMQGNEPEFDTEYEDNVPYDPELLVSERGTHWIDEGHHRLVASRLRGDPSRRVYGGPLG